MTGEDVANSLYYVHLDLATDELLAAPPRRPEDAISPRSSNESARSAIPRKPLPASARFPRPEASAAADGTTASAAPSAPAQPPGLTQRLSDSLTIAATADPHSTRERMDGYPSNSTFRDRRPGSPSQQPETSSPPLPPPPKMPLSKSMSASRKPVGSQPLASQENENPTPRSSTPPRRPVTPTQTSPRATAAREPGQTTSPSRAAGPRYNLLSPGKSGHHRPSFMPFSLALIRRDPTTGGQWNVGKISSFQTNIPTPDMAAPTLNPDDMGSLSGAQKIDIRLETSGYAKYRDLPTLTAINAYRPGSGHSFAQAMKGLAPGSNSGPAPAFRGGPPAGAEGGFTRQVAMAYSKTWTSNIKKAFHRHDRRSSATGGEMAISPDDGALPQPPNRNIHSRTDSASTTGSVDSQLGLQREASPPATMTTQPGPGLKPKGYVFISPWDGRCEFHTSTSGRSLKCRHILDPKSPKFNPVAVAQNIRDAQAVGRSRGDELVAAMSGAKPVSELRFNLPSGDVLKASSPSKGEGNGKWDSAQHQLQGRFSKLVHRLEARSSDEEYDDDGEDDDNMMNLGRENAGGGSRGNRAKLGKLIIHDEGLKMLDLVVAANVGVWWTTWERTYTA